jgi:hypothetical protein
MEHPAHWILPSRQKKEKPTKTNQSQFMVSCCLAQWARGGGGGAASHYLPLWLPLRRQWQLLPAAAALLQVEESWGLSSSPSQTQLQELAGVRWLVATQLQPPAGMAEELAAAAAAQGFIPSEASWAPGSAGWEQVWAAICMVRSGLETAALVILPGGHCEWRN